jgi:hypothetical protein
LVSGDGKPSRRGRAAFKVYTTALRCVVNDDLKTLPAPHHARIPPRRAANEPPHRRQPSGPASAPPLARASVRLPPKACHACGESLSTSLSAVLMDREGVSYHLICWCKIMDAQAAVERRGTRPPPRAKPPRKPRTL